jgi:pyruvate/2-oxoglutarate/acetoin dehydrogenase E1 component
MPTDISTDTRPGSTATSMSYIRAVNEALRVSMQQDGSVITFGEDVAIPGGPFGSSRGLLEEFGPLRVFDTPISESAMVGTALGASMAGLRPVVEIMYGDFLLVAMDQIINQVANTRYVSNGRLTAPLTIRTQHGSTPGACAQHSQCLEVMFAHTPGLRVAVPSTAADAFSLLRTAIASDDPVLVMESRKLYATKGTIDTSAPVAAVGGSATVRRGRDVTAVAWGTTLQPTLDAAAELSADGIEVEVIDLRWAAPLDIESIAGSVSRTGRLVVAHEANVNAGLGAEIVAAVVEQLGPRAARVARVGVPDVPMPASATLSNAVLPSVRSISAKLRALVA